MAVSGHNGDNETLIGMSNSIGLKFYDESDKEIKITKTNSPLNIFIKRDLKPPAYNYTYVTPMNNSTGLYLTNAFRVHAKNASIHIELKPLNNSIGYVLAIKLGATPLINSSYADYTSFKIFCPGIKKIFLKNFF